MKAGWEWEVGEATQDTALVRALGLAHHSQPFLDEGCCRTMTEIVAAEEMDLGQASRVAQLVRLAPALFEICVVRGLDALSLEPVIRRKLPALRAAQEEMISVASSV